MRSVIAAVLISSACSSGPSKRSQPPTTASAPRDAAAPPTTTTDAPTKPPSCAERADNLRRALAQPEPPNFYVELPSSKSWQPLTTPGPMPAVALRQNGQWFSEGTLAWADLKEQLEAVATEELRDGATGPLVLYVGADRNAKAQALIDRLPYLTSRFELRLVVSRIPPPTWSETFPMPAWVAPWVRTWWQEVQQLNDQPAKKLQAFRDAVVRATGKHCPQLPEVFRKVSDANPANKTATLNRGLPLAMSACRCTGVVPGFGFIATLMTKALPITGWLPLKTVPALPMDANIDALVAKLARQ